jgi:molybdopterin synthase catalytic subunit
MQVLLRYFAVVRERVGKDEESIEIPDGCTVDQLRALLAQKHAGLAPLLGHVRAAVNREIVPWDHDLKEGDEVALIPPVAGGAGCFRIRSSPLVADEAIQAVSDEGVGGVVVFHGVVRRRSAGKTVERLHYEAYAEMAEDEFRKIADETTARWPGTRVAILHRVGTLEVGETAVVVATAAPHRAEAFSACRFVIDTLKQRAPIWKKEVGVDGEVWVGFGP